MSMFTRSPGWRSWLMGLMLLGVALVARAEMTVEIVGGAASRLPIAIAPFKDETSRVREPLTPTVKKDLVFTGAFSIVPADGVANLPFTPQEVRYPDWQGAGAKYLAVGKVEAAGGGEVKIRFQLLEVASRRQLTQGEFTVPPERARDVAHTIADMIYEAITGQKGVFNTRIAYVLQSGRDYQLQIADVDGSRPQTVLRSKEPIISPAWSPSGRYLAYVSFETKKPVVWVQDLSTGERRAVGNFKGSNSAPAWSPDGTRLALTLTTSGNSQIYVMNAEGGSPKRVAYGEAIDTEPTWTPDGNSLLFVSDRSGGPQIYRVDANGGTPQRLTFQGGYNVSPKVAPDGKRFTFIRKEGGRFRVMVQEFGSHDSRVLSDAAYNERPSFAPNGQMVLYASDEGRQSVLYAINPENGQRIRLGTVNGDVQDPAWGPFNTP
ncbi:Tol-Pal system beta propeller repeat protein TolB [Crenobacter cavernae]|nr:Tol-Pal system beta propeller repeat protein TolB [Crenobacter cavernae]